MPCLDLLAQLREHHESLGALGASVIAVGGAADYQAQHLQDDGVPFPLLLDPDGELRNALGVDTKLSKREMMSWASAKNYVSVIGRRRQGKVSRTHAEDRPAVVILDDQLKMVWSHVGTALGDYPTIDEIKTAITAEVKP